MVREKQTHLRKWLNTLVRRLSVLIGSGFLTLVGCWSPLAAAVPQTSMMVQQRPTITVGFDAEILSETEIKDYKAALNVWMKRVARDVGINLDIIIYEDAAAFIRGIRHDGLQWLNISPKTYFEIVETGRLTDEFEIVYCPTMYGDRKTRRYQLIVRADSGIFDIRDLKGKTICLKQKNELGEIYFHTFLRKHQIVDPAAYFSSIELKMKFSQVVLSVFFGHQDAGVATNGAFEIMAELNPQIGRQLKSLDTSPEFVHGLGLLSTSIDEQTKRSIIKSIFSLQDTPDGRQILMLFNIDNLRPLDESELETVRTLLEK